MSAAMSRSMRGRLDRRAARRRSSLVLAGTLGVVAMLLASWVATADEVQPLPEVTPVAVEDEADEAPDEPDATPDDADVLEDVPTVTYEVYLARDPFEPVVPEDMPQSDTSDPGGTDGPVDSDDQDSPRDRVDPDDPDAPRDPVDPDDPSGPRDPVDPDDPDECAGKDEVVCDGQVVTLLDITEVDGEPVAVIQVDTTVYEVQPGQQFAGRFQLLEIRTEEVEILFGDQRETLEMNEHVLK